MRRMFRDGLVGAALLLLPGCADPTLPLMFAGSVVANLGAQAAFAGATTPSLGGRVTSVGAFARAPRDCALLEGLMLTTYNHNRSLPPGAYDRLQLVELTVAETNQCYREFAVGRSRHEALLKDWRNRGAPPPPRN